MPSSTSSAGDGSRARVPTSRGATGTGEATARVLARATWEGGQRWLRRIVEEGLLTPRGVVGLWPARRTDDGDDVVLEDGTVLHTLRQQRERSQGGYAALADFVAPEGDHMGAFAVSIHGADELAAQLREEHDDYGAIMV